MKKWIFFFLFLSVTSIVFSQGSDSLRRLYNNETIYRYGNFFRKGNERLSFGQLKYEFSFSELGAADYRMARNYRTISQIIGVVALGCSVTSIVSVNDKPKRTYLFLGAGLVLNITGAYYRTRSARHLDQALWQRNKDLLFR